MKSSDAVSELALQPAAAVGAAATLLSALADRSGAVVGVATGDGAIAPPIRSMGDIVGTASVYLAK